MNGVETVGTVPSDGVDYEQGMDGDGVLPVFSDGVGDDVGGIEVGLSVSIVDPFVSEQECGGASVFALRRVEGTD